MNPNYPTLYCDVDGVLNILKSKPTDAITRVVRRKLPHFARYVKIPVRVTWREEIIQEIANLPVNLVWLTTWNYEAVEKLEPLLGLKSENVLLYKMKAKEINNQKHKYDLLRSHQQQNPTQFIWVDDVATRFYNESDWAENHKRLIIKPNHREGITLVELNQIKEFLGLI